MHPQLGRLVHLLPAAALAAQPARHPRCSCCPDFIFDRCSWAGPPHPGYLLSETRSGPRAAVTSSADARRCSRRSLKILFLSILLAQALLERPLFTWFAESGHQYAVVNLALLERGGSILGMNFWEV